MRIRAIALLTFSGFLRNKLMILFLTLFAVVVLLMMTPLMVFRAQAGAPGMPHAESMVLGLIGSIMSLLSGFGSLLAAWAAADAVWADIRSGTILAVLARPIRRWEFLLGKFLGVQLLMAAYVLMMLALSYLLAAIGGERIHPAPWLLIVYPLVRYALYSGLAMLLATVMHPVVSFAIMLVIMVAELIVAPASRAPYLPAWLKAGLYAALPSPELLSEARFLTITEASLKQTSPLHHLTVLGYGLDWALVFFLLAAWLFSRRSLAP
ncbi:MAG TPA: ABC transporter permease subunit [Bryobacteraceae bacterium]|nr:ABC transporter permease subunit [Bryobacteraceae bacterium]